MQKAVVAGEEGRSGSESGSTSQRHGSADPDPPQNFMDPEHCGAGYGRVGGSHASEGGGDDVC